MASFFLSSLFATSCSRSLPPLLCSRLSSSFFFALPSSVRSSLKEKQIETPAALEGEPRSREERRETRDVDGEKRRGSETNAEKERRGNEEKRLQTQTVSEEMREGGRG